MVPDLLPLAVDLIDLSWWQQFSCELRGRWFCSNICSHNISDMHEDVDFSGWELPPLEDDPDREPPPEREYSGGVWIGSDLTGLRHAGTGVMDLGEFVCNDLASVRPTVVALAELGSTDFHSLSQKERVDALLVLEQHRAWLDGLQQQVLAEVSLGDPSGDKWIREEVACALGLSPVTAGAKLKNAEQLCTRLPGHPRAAAGRADQ